MIIFGIDQGLENTGWSISKFEDGKIKVIKKGIILHPSKIKKTVISSRQSRLANIFFDLEELFKNNKIDFVVCEQINGNRVKYVNMVSGFIHMLSGKYKKPVLDFIPSSVKKNLTGDGRASKDDIIKKINELTGEKIEIEHIADSVAIAKKGFDVAINKITFNDGDLNKIDDYNNQLDFYKILKKKVD